MRRVAVSSSCIRSVGYTVGSGILEVEFHGGEVYRYRQVPLEEHEALMASGSKGQHLNRRIRENYPAERLGNAS